MKTQIRLISILIVLLLSILACQSPFSTSDSNSNLLQTQTSMAVTLTAMNKRQPTATLIQQDNYSPTETPELSGGQIQEKFNTANILIFEDMFANTYYVHVVSKAITSMGGNQVYVGDAIGTFLEKLDSKTNWDLIIVASEFRNSITGEYWTKIKDQVDKGVAVVAEVWYLDTISDGKIAPLLKECGVEVQASLDRGSGFHTFDYPVYWVEPNSPVFNTPNQVEEFRYSIQDAGIGDVGDLLKLSEGSNATILASHSDGQAIEDGLLTSCMQGRVLFQTFSSHDYPTDEMVALWQNYITYTLTNHFQATR